MGDMQAKFSVCINNKLWRKLLTELERIKEALYAHEVLEEQNAAQSLNFLNEFQLEWGFGPCYGRCVGNV